MRKSRNIDSDLFIDAPFGILQLTRGGKLRRANLAIAEILGYDSPEELIETVNRKGIAETLLVGPAARTALLEEAPADGRWRRFEERYRRKDGTIVHAALLVRTSVATGAAEAQREAFVEDVTARKRADEALPQERVFLSVLMDAMPDYIYFKDTQSRFILTNKAHARAFSLRDPAEAIGKTDFDFNTKESAQVSFDDEQRIIATGEPVIDVVEKETWPDRPDTWVSTTKMPFRDADGTIVGTFGISRDITQRRRDEERNIRLATLVDSSADAIAGLDLNRLVTSWSKGAERMYGYTAEEAIGQPSSLFMPPELEAEALRLRSRVMRGESVESFETLRRRKDGTLMNVSLVLSPIRNADGEIIGTASIARDITAQKALQAQIMRAQRLESLSTLAGGVAHQFNNVNMVVKGYLDILLHAEDLPETARTYLLEAMNGVQRAIDITDRLQGLAGSRETKWERVRMSDVVRTLLPLFENRIHELGVTVNLELHETAMLTIDQSQLGFIITSLVTNSLDALVGQPRRVVTLRTGSREEFAFLEVTDSGCGIPAENMARLFTPFFTTKGEWAPAGSPQSMVRGVGLSLAVCHSTVSERGGRIEVESDPVRGSLFRVLLPAEMTSPA